MICRSIPRLALIALLGFFATPLLAESRILALADQGEWNAIGRLNRGGFNTTSTCTGTLVAPDLVLTAAHCVASHRAATAEKLREIVFVAGWNRGEHAASSVASALHFHPGNLAGNLSLDAIPADIALVRLETPIEITPIALAPLPAPSQTTSFVAYRNDRLHAPTLTDDCPQAKLRPGLLYLGCAVVSGNSGAPVLIGTEAGPALIAVVSARSRGGAYAVIPDDWLMDFLAQDG